MTRSVTPRRVLVTGATGFVGAATVRRLLERGHAVQVVVRNPSTGWRIADLFDRIEVIEADLAELSRHESALRAFKPDAVIHAAWQGVQSAQRNDGDLQALNVRQSIALFELAQNIGVHQFSFIGSQAEYGPHADVISELTPLRPSCSYGLAKTQVGCTILARAKSQGIVFSWLRLFSSYGPMDDPGWLLPSVILKLLRGETPQLTAGEQKWDYLYVDDAARAIVAVLERSTAGIFNLASGSVCSLRSVMEQVRDLVDASALLAFGAIPYRVGQPMLLQADVSALKAATGWMPVVPLHVGLAETVRWYRKIATNVGALK